MDATYSLLSITVWHSHPSVNWSEIDMRMRSFGALLFPPELVPIDVSPVKEHYDCTLQKRQGPRFRLEPRAFAFEWA